MLRGREKTGADRESDLASPLFSQSQTLIILLLINSSQSHPTHSLSPPPSKQAFEPPYQKKKKRILQITSQRTHSSFTLSLILSCSKLKWQLTLSITPSNTTNVHSPNATTPQTPHPPHHFSSNPLHPPYTTTSLSRTLLQTHISPIPSLKPHLPPPPPKPPRPSTSSATISPPITFSWPMRRRVVSSSCLLAKPHRSAATSSSQR